MGTYTRKHLDEAGMEPTLELLLRGAGDGKRVTYGVIADHLASKLAIPKVFSTHIGTVAGALMHRIHVDYPDAPLINMLVVNVGNWEPGDGGDGFLAEWYGLTIAQLLRNREKYVQQAINEVKAYDKWPEVYETIFKRPFIPMAGTEDYEPDGQGDNPRFTNFGPESEDHKRLKAHIRDNPSAIGIRGKVSRARNEAPLLSGDRMDVEFLIGARRVGVEVKSWRSGNADLERGIYQCVKYRAVMIAECGFGDDDADCEAILVTERELPFALKSLARQLKVRWHCIKVNDPGLATRTKIT